MKLLEVFETVEDFEDLLSAAEAEAKTGWEMDFTADIREKFFLYAGEMFLSERQLELLEKIARA